VHEALSLVKCEAACFIGAAAWVALAALWALVSGAITV